MKKYILSLIGFSACVAAVAQNYNPTVEVTGTYKVKPIELSKPAVSVAVPDTVTKFDIDFDYSVAPKAYKGSYVFTPYEVDVLPAASLEKDKQLFLKVGAGYALHPQLDVVWAPRLKSQKHKLNLYGTHRSYVGNYRAISAVDASGSGKASKALEWDGSTKYWGYETYTNAGVEGTVRFDSGIFNYNVAYLGYANRDSTLRRHYDAGRVDLSIETLKDRADNYFYKFAFSYLFGQDQLHSLVTPSIVPLGGISEHLTEHNFGLNLQIGNNYNKTNHLLIDIRLDGAVYSSYMNSFVGELSLNPKYTFRKNRWSGDIGLLLDVPFSEDITDWGYSDEDLQTSATLHSGVGQIIYPDIFLGYDIIRRSLNIYLSATGGIQTNRLSSALGQNPYLSLNYAQNFYGMAMMANTIEHINAQVGVRGQIAARLNYKVNAGWAYRSNELLDAVILSNAYGPTATSTTAMGATGIAVGTLLPGVAYSTLGLAYASADLVWHSKSFTADLRARYNNSSLIRKHQIGFEASPVDLWANLSYRWNERISVGLHGHFASARRGWIATYYPTSGTNPTYDDDFDLFASARTKSDDEESTEDLLYGTSLDISTIYKIPGYLNVGLSAEYQYSRKLSFWIYADNLLGQTIQIHPLYAHSGIYATLGLTLSF